MGEAKNNIPYDLYRTVNDLRDKFKHGHHIIKILESQLETARQNISLLQGQVRLANETIDNLKQQFNEADLTLSYLTDNPKSNNERQADSFKHSVRENNVYVQTSSVHGQRDEEYENERKLSDQENRSPKHVAIPNSGDTVDQMGEFDTAERSKSPSCQEKRGYGQERPKSPYEQQLRQVLDALQDEDPRRLNISAAHESAREIANVSQSQQQLCMCPECVPSSGNSGTSAHISYQDTSSRAPPCSCDLTGTQLSYHEECSKHHAKAIGSSTDGSPLNHQVTRSVHEPEREISAPSHYISGGSHTSRSVDYSSRCTGPCCSSVDPSKVYKIVESSPVVPHYISSRSSRHQHQLDANGKIVGHCDDKCRCHAFVNYAPFGYQVVESSPGIPQAIQPISPILPSKKNKRYHPVAPGDEPPHLKYTKVKRIDGSKVAAQKTIQDFSKRRFHPYNPRWDLDLLIVPPPIPALDLMSVLGAEKNSNYEMDKESSATGASVVDQEKREGSTVGTDSREATVVKSKVINSGGTVIVLTEGENVDLTRSTVMHSTPKVYPAESRASVEIPAPFEDRSRLQQDQTKYNFESGVNIGIDKKNLEERRQQINPRNSASDNPSLQFPVISISGLPSLHNPPSEGQYAPQTTNPTSVDQLSNFNKGLVYNSAASDIRFKVPEASTQNESVISTVSIKRERNNNTFTNSALSLVLQHQKTTDHTDNSKELSSNLTARYEQVLFQRNDDFSTIGNDDDYVIQNRVKGKVH